MKKAVQLIFLKDTSEDGDKDGCYVFVEDDTEFDAVYKVFEVMLDEIDFEYE